jgi:hypothetical protein
MRGSKATWFSPAVSLKDGRRWSSTMRSLGRGEAEVVMGLNLGGGRQGSRPLL